VSTNTVPMYGVVLITNARRERHRAQGWFSASEGTVVSASDSLEASDQSERRCLAQGTIDARALDVLAWGTASLPPVTF
jgi:hypothetical protein